MRVAVTAAIALAALVGSTTAPAAEPPEPEAWRPCGSRGDGSRPQQLPTPVGARVGPVVIWPSIRARVERYGADGWAYYVKAPVIVPARVHVTLAVAPGFEHLAAFQARTWVSSVRFEGCAPGTPAFPGAYEGTVGRYTGFPFGIALARRSLCVPLEAWVEGRAEPVRRLVPFGRASCPAR